MYGGHVAPRRRSILGRTVLVITLLVFVGVIVGAGFFHIVVGANGLRLVPKAEFGYQGTLVDLRSSTDVREVSSEVLWQVARTGGLDGLLTPEVAATIERVGVAVRGLDERYRLSDSAVQVGRIAQEKYDALDQRYDVSGKARAVENRAQQAFEQANQWLRRQ